MLVALSWVVALGTRWWLSAEHPADCRCVRQRQGCAETSSLRPL